MDYVWGWWFSWEKDGTVSTPRKTQKSIWIFRWKEEHGQPYEEGLGVWQLSASSFSQETWALPSEAPIITEETKYYPKKSRLAIYMAITGSEVPQIAEEPDLSRDHIVKTTSSNIVCPLISVSESSNNSNKKT